MEMDTAATYGTSLLFPLLCCETWLYQTHCANSHFQLDLYDRDKVLTAVLAMLTSSSRNRQTREYGSAHNIMVHALTKPGLSQHFINIHMIVHISSVSWSARGHFQQHDLY